MTIPPMLLDASELRHSAFLSRNGYIEDAKEEERQFKLSNPWTERETAIFQQKYIKYPKQFRKISSYLPNKSVNDCVAYYYYSKLATNYKELVRNQQKRSRMEKRGRRRPDDAEEEAEDEDDDEGDMAGGGAAAAEAVAPPVAATAGKKRDRSGGRVRSKPRGISRELIGLAIDLSNQGKTAARERGRRAAAAKAEAGGEGDGEAEEANEGEDEGEEPPTAAGDDAEDDGEDAEDDGEGEASADAEEAERAKSSTAVPTSALPTHLDLYDDDDEERNTAHTADARKKPTAHSDDEGGEREEEEGEEEEEELLHSLLPSSSGAADKEDSNGPSASTSPKTTKRRRLSKSTAPGPPSASTAAGDARPYWTDDERALFLSGLDEFGKAFGLIAAHVGTKSADKCKNYWNNNKVTHHHTRPQRTPTARHYASTPLTPLSPLCAAAFACLQVKLRLEERLEERRGPVERPQGRRRGGGQGRRGRLPPLGCRRLHSPSGGRARDGCGRGVRRSAPLLLRVQRQRPQQRLRLGRRGRRRRRRCGSRQGPPPTPTLTTPPHLRPPRCDDLIPTIEFHRTHRVEAYQHMHHHLSEPLPPPPSPIWLRHHPLSTTPSHPLCVRVSPLSRSLLRAELVGSQGSSFQPSLWG